MKNAKAKCRWCGTPFMTVKITHYYCSRPCSQSDFNSRRVYVKPEIVCDFSIPLGAVIEIALNAGKIALVDAADLPLIAGYKWHAGKHGKNWRVTAHYKRNAPAVFLHRIIMQAPEGIPVDHANGDSLDNRRCNLRFATHAQNQCNSRCRSASGYKGVTIHSRGSRPWEAKVTISGKSKRIGLFATREEAALAYDEAARRHYGEFAALNFPREGEQSCLR